MANCNNGVLVPGRDEAISTTLNNGVLVPRHDEAVSTTSDNGLVSGELAQDGQRPITESRDPDAKEHEPEIAQLGNDLDIEMALHLVNRAPNFPRLGHKISVLGLGIPGIRYERKTSGETQCIRCRVIDRNSSISAGVTCKGYSVGVTYAIGVNSDRSTFKETTFRISIGGGGPASAQTGSKWSKRYTTAPNKGYVVLGIFSGADGIPRERVISIKHPSLLFWYFFYAIVRIRGISWFLSLKDVKGFAIYNVSGPYKSLVRW